MAITLQAFQKAYATLESDQIFDDGLPHMKPLNAAIEADGGAPISKDESKAFWADWLEEEVGQKQPEPTPEFVTLRVTKAGSDPVSIPVKGKTYAVRVGVDSRLPIAAKSILEDSDCEFEEV